MTENNSIVTYFNNIAKLPLLTKEEEQELFTCMKTSSDEKAREKAREKIITHNIRLAFKIAKDYVKSGISLADLVQEGTKGIVKACDHFSLNKDVRFSTYATLWIQQHVNRYVKKHTKNVFIPEYVVNLARRIHRIMREEETKGSKVTPQLIQKILLERFKLKIDLKTIQDTLKICQAEVSISTKIGDDGDTELGEILPDSKTVSPDNEVVKDFQLKCLAKALMELSMNERLTINFRYGIGTFTDLNFKQIAKMFDMTEDEVRQIAIEALKDLKIDLETTDRSEIKELFAA